MTAQAHAVAGNGTPQLTDMSLFRQQCYVDGQWIDADGGETINVTNPATGEVLGTIPKLGADEPRRAIEAAEQAWPAWRRSSSTGSSATRSSSRGWSRVSRR